MLKLSKSFLQLTPAQWREDLRFFAEELPKRHANAFQYISRERFTEEVAALDAQLDHLNGDEVYAGIDRIAQLVGQTIGERPNSYQEAREMRLPNSRLVVRYSTQFYKFVETGENLIRPDREVIPSWTDFKSGRDPALEWVLAQSASLRDKH